MSAQRLADRTHELGHHLTRSTIAGMEAGRRGTVTVADLLVLAVALDVSPVALVFPVGYEQHTEYLPDQQIETLTGAEWWSGLGQPVAIADRVAFAGNSQALVFARMHRAWLRRWESDRSRATDAIDGATREFFVRSADADLENLKASRDRMGVAGYLLPQLEPHQQSALGEPGAP